MTGEGDSGGHSQPEACFGTKTLRRHKMKRNLNDVVFIDVDGDNFHNVIIIDGPKAVQQNVQDSGVMRRDERIPLESIISIDDDDESTDIHPENSVESRGDLDSDASSGKRSWPASNHSQKSVDLEADECQFIRERKSPVKLSKCKRTYSGKAPSRNRYGLGPMSESTSSESDFSDCELMEGSVGKLREQWEQAYLKRKYDLGTAKSDLGDQPSASASNTDTSPDIEGENITEQHQATPVCSSSSNENLEKDNLPSLFVPDASNLGVTSLNPEVENSFAEFAFKVDVESLRCKIDSVEKSQISDVNDDIQNEEASLCKSHSLVETQVNLVASKEKDEGLHQASNGCTSQIPNESRYGGTILEGKKKSVSRVQSDWKPRPSDETWINCGAPPFKGKVQSQFVPEKAFFCTSLSAEKLDVNNEKDSYQERKKPVSGEPSSSHAPHNETQIKKCKSCLTRKEPVLESMHFSEQNNEIDHITHAQDGQRDIINEREKLKETEEYKRAIEEEWASRQRQLKLQAEEVQRLKKRKKAANMRLLDMERRQRLRVLEMRETQKKDEENMNMKEKLRLEVRKELDKLEMTCSDMASLLRGLGIHVGGGFCPSSNEVHAAYKRALLKFHPDRASRTDIYNQVEAEEKFKLISRMKEKFMLLHDRIYE